MHDCVARQYIPTVDCMATGVVACTTLSKSDY
jgi:hypothetical protein